MLRFLTGKVRSVSDNVVVLDVGGIGFELICTGRAAELCSEGEPADLVTHVQFSEAGPTLFGFTDDRERALFLKLITVKGVGGKMAMNILKHTSPDRVVAWILSSDINSMMQIPGIGRKTAERLCFEMRPHLEGKDGEFSSVAPLYDGRLSTAIDALRSLGFAQNELGEAISRLKKSGFLDGEDLTEEKIIRLALKELKRN